jgi:hypothetical protein
LITEVMVEGDEDELRSLAQWLRAEPSLRSAAVSLKQAPARPGDMGSWVEAVQLVTDNGWQAASFVLSLMTWRQTRPQQPVVTIRHGEVEVSVPCDRPEEAARIAALLQQAAQAHGPAGPAPASGREADDRSGEAGAAGPRQ